MKELQMVF